MQVSRTVAVEGGTTDLYGRRKDDHLHINLLSWNHGVINELLIEAKKAWNEERITGVSIYAEEYGRWRCVATRPKRPIRSIILNTEIKNLLLQDVGDFLSSKSWYAECGIPFRRGYLLVKSLPCLVRLIYSDIRSPIVWSAWLRKDVPHTLHCRRVWPEHIHHLPLSQRA